MTDEGWLQRLPAATQERIAELMLTHVRTTVALAELTDIGDIDLALADLDTAGAAVTSLRGQVTLGWETSVAWGRWAAAFELMARTIEDATDPTG
jgi:hypothetical protein